MVGEDPGTVEERGRVEEEAGDARTLSFEAIYCSSYSRLVGQVTMVTTSRVEAEDVVQEASPGCGCAGHVCRATTTSRRGCAG
jgi:hypothetical protein